MARAKQSQESSQKRWSVGGGESHELTRFKMRVQDVFASGVREVVHLANCRRCPGATTRARLASRATSRENATTIPFIRPAETAELEICDTVEILSQLIWSSSTRELRSRL